MAQSCPVTSRNVDIVFAQTICCTEIDCEREKKRNDPGQDHDLVIPGNISDDEEPTNKSSRYEKRCENQRCCRDGKNCRSAIGNLPVRSYASIRHSDVGSDMRSRTGNSNNRVSRSDKIMYDAPSLEAINYSRSTTFVDVLVFEVNEPS